MSMPRMIGRSTRLDISELSVTTTGVLSIKAASGCRELVGIGCGVDVARLENLVYAYRVLRAVTIEALVLRRAYQLHVALRSMCMLKPTYEGDDSEAGCFHVELELELAAERVNLGIISQ